MSATWKPGDLVDLAGTDTFWDEGDEEPCVVCRVLEDGRVLIFLPDPAGARLVEKDAGELEPWAQDTAVYVLFAFDEGYAAGGTGDLRAAAEHTTDEAARAWARGIAESTGYLDLRDQWQLVALLSGGQTWRAIPLEP